MAQRARATLGQVIKEQREELGINRGDLVHRLKSRGVKMARSTLQLWEEKNGRKWDLDWNPDFFTALAESLEISEIELLDRMGFPVIPDGYTLADMEMAARIRQIPEVQRKQVVHALITVLENLGIGPGDENGDNE